MTPAHRPPVAPPPESSTADLVASTAKPGRDQAKLSEFESEVIAIFVETLQTLGLPRSLGEIYGLLYATAEPLGFAEIHERLQLSKGSISGGLKALREFGAVRLIVRGGQGRDVYEPELEMRKLIQAYIVGKLQPQLVASTQRIDRLETLLAEESVPVGVRKQLQSRASKLTKWRKRASGLLPWIEKFLG